MGKVGGGRILKNARALNHNQNISENCQNFDNILKDLLPGGILDIFFVILINTVV